MTTKYPAQIDSTSNLPNVSDNESSIQGVMFNRLRDTIIAIESELGVQPSNPHGTVRARLDVLENLVTNNSGIQIGKDIGGTISNPTVIGLQGNPISNTDPSENQVLSWNGVVWEPVDQLTIDDLLPNSVQVGQTILWDGSNYVSGSYAQDDVLPPVTVTLMAGSNLVEVGQPVIHPVFSASYSLPATSGTLKDSDNNVVQTLSTLNSFASDFSFTKNSFGAFVDFTLTASMGRFIKTDATRITWGQKSYWGLGSAGGTGSSFITNLSNNLLTSNSNITFSLTAGVNQKIYFACRSAYGTQVFTINNVQGGFTKTGTFSVTNNFGFAENYDLYESNVNNLGFVNVLVSNGLELLAVNALMGSIVYNSPYGNTGAAIAGTFVNTVGPGVPANKTLRTVNTNSCDWVDAYQAIINASVGVTNLTVKNQTVLANSVTGLITINLPASGLISGIEIVIKDLGAAVTNNITIQGNGNEIDGNNNYVINSNLGYVRLITNGSDWFVVGEG
jgi:hypothetical protein